MRSFILLAFAAAAIAVPTSNSSSMAPIYDSVFSPERLEANHWLVYFNEDRVQNLDLNGHYSTIGRNLSAAIEFEFDMPPHVIGYSAFLSPEELEVVRRDSNVKGVEQDGWWDLDDVRTVEEDNVDLGIYDETCDYPSSSTNSSTEDVTGQCHRNAKRRDEANIWCNLVITSATKKTPGPAQGTYSYPDSAGSRTVIWVLDSGIYTQHQDFTGRAMNLASFVPGQPQTSGDITGHGTHVASIAAGQRNGVAKKAAINSVQVIDSKGKTSISQVMKGVNYVKTSLNANLDVVHGNVVLLSLGLGTPGDHNLRRSFTALTDTPGVHVVAAAGNMNKDAGGTFPSRFSNVNGVAACNCNYDKWSSSNFGAGVDFIAPGVSITAASRNGKTFNSVMSGTSQAAPHVAGIMALFLSEEPGLTQQQMRATMDVNADKGYVTGFPSGTRTLFANNGYGKARPAPFLKP